MEGISVSSTFAWIFPHKRSILGYPHCHHFRTPPDLSRYWVLSSNKDRDNTKLHSWRCSGNIHASKHSGEGKKQVDFRGVHSTDDLL